MKDPIVQLQVFYEIAMATGTGLDLNAMLRTSLIAYLKKLVCSAGLVLRLEQDQKGQWRYARQYAIPKNAWESRLVLAIVAQLPKEMDQNGLDAFCSNLPETGQIGETDFFHLMSLPGFGLLIVVKKGGPLEPHLIKSLSQMNAKLSDACQACLQNERVRKMNWQLSDEIRRRKAAEKAKKQFLARMSHEIFTPLNQMISAGRLLQDTEINAEQAGLLATQSQSADHLHRLLSDLLDFSMASAARFESSHQAFNVQDLVRSVAGAHGDAAAEKGLVLGSETGKGVPPRVRGDAEGIRLVLDELVANAIKFTQKGHVTLRVRAEVRNESKAEIEFAVIDTGMGLHEEEKAFMFDFFSQSENSGTGRSGELSLGLARARHYVRAMDGEFSVESLPGQGTEFKFTLTMEIPGNATGEGKIRTGTSSGMAGARILVVDDNPVNCSLLAAVCRKQGAAADVASGGKAALDMLRNQAYDLVFMDCQMPDMDGYEATARIRSGDSGVLSPGIPVVAVTAHVSLENREKCRQAGMNGFIPKPVTLEKLKAVAFSLLPEVS